MKQITLIFLLTSFLLAITQAHAHAKPLIHPPLPQESLDTEKVAIVSLKQPMSEAAIAELLQDYPELKLRRVFTEAITGFSVYGPVRAIGELAKTAQVESYSPVNMYSVDLEPIRVQLSNKPPRKRVDSNLEIIGAEAVRGHFDASHQRLTGKGVKVGVIDTGIDYHHPDLQRSYKGGHDLVDSDTDPMETTGYYGQGTLHGTHVAGIIAANGKIEGVAPNATIIAYRALGPGGSGTTEQVLAAIEEAIKDRVDVLNLSLGNNINGPDLPISLALNRAVEKGIIAVTSSGNSGPNMWTVGSPGTASKAISVGASTPLLEVPFLKIDGLDEPLRLEPMQGSILWKLDRTYPMVAGGIGKPEQLTDVAGKIVLIERGELTFSEKAKNAKEKGAVAVIIYNHMNGPFVGNLDQEISIPVATTDKTTGTLLKGKLGSKPIYVQTTIIEEKDYLADFSSRGPVTHTWEIKPDIVAPGVAITSTIPGGYLSLQGTSMAAPHVAGAAALLKQAHPDWGPEEVKAALMNTAKPIIDRTGKPYRSYEQGAGRIQIEEALETNSLVIPASLQFGKFQLAERQHEHTQTLTVKNISQAPVHYRFDAPGPKDGIRFELPLSFELAAGEEKKVEVTMSVDPAELKKKIHDGHLTVWANTNTIQIPYLYVLEEPNYPRVMGFAFGPGDKQDWYRYEVYLPGGAEEFGIALFDPDTFRFVQFLDWKKNVAPGMLKVEIPPDALPETGLYIAKVFARKAGKEDMIETGVVFSKPLK